MSFTMFIDESGQDLRESPYEVLAGVAIEDRDLWNLISSIQQLEHDIFDGRYTRGGHELKAKKLLKAKVFRQAATYPAFDSTERRRLASSCLQHGEGADRAQLAALGQAKIDFAARVLTLCAQHRCRAFASIIPRAAPRPASRDFLRKDYAYLFERLFYFLEDVSPEAMGFVVFDELERSQSHLLIDQMTRYFLTTHKGRTRSSRIIPEPFFVHSDLTTMIQVADLVAYLIAWGVRVATMTSPARQELVDLASLVVGMRHRSTREMGNNPNFTIWSFAVIDDLRAADERR